jgi:type VI secretion system secreted protein VgrG
MIKTHSCIKLFVDPLVSLGVSDYDITSLCGQDHLFAPFDFELQVTLAGERPDISLLQGAPISFELLAHNVSSIYHGHIYATRLTHTHPYSLSLFIAPKLSWLTTTTHSRIFAVDKPMSVVEIVTYIFGLHQGLAFRWELAQHYPTLDVCVQYLESDYNFVMRLLKDAGIYFYFDHTADSHTLVLTDAAIPTHGAWQQAYHAEQTHLPPYISQWQVSANALALRTIEGASHYANWQAGTLFELQGHPMSAHNTRYYVSSIYHQLSLDDTEAGGTRYTNQFYARLHTQAFMPTLNPSCVPAQLGTTLHPARYQKIAPPITSPCIRGLLLATVTGPKQKEIYTDKYGRIKIKFPWDEINHTEENTFAWVPVKQAWAANQVGTAFIPRVGQEVVVMFEEGNPNAPIVIGVMPTPANRPPFASTSRSGFVSRSLGANNQATKGNQFIFDDDPTRPAITLSASRDLVITTANDVNTHVKGSYTTTVAHGNVAQHTNHTFTLNAKDAVHLVSGNSRISVTPTDIIIEADKIVFEKSQQMIGNRTTLPIATQNISTRKGNNNFTELKSSLPSNTPNPQKNTNNSDNSIQESHQFLPNLSLDLNILPATEGNISYENKLFFYKVVLSGNISMQKSGNYSPVTFSLTHYKLEARQTLGNFFSELRIQPNSHEQMVLGSEVTGEFVSSSVQVVALNPPYLRFKSNPAPLQKKFDEWQISGNLDFTLDLISQHKPPETLQQNQYAKWLEQEWNNIRLGTLVASTIALGIRLAPTIERLILAAIIAAA